MILPLGWVGMNAAYRRGQGLLVKITASGLKIVADVRVSQLVWEHCPTADLRPRSVGKSGAGISVFDNGDSMIGWTLGSSSNGG